jgi:hypothetical protein
MHEITVRYYQASSSGRISEAKEIKEIRFRKIVLRTQVQETDVGSTITGTVNFSLRIMKKYQVFRKGPFNDGDF